MNETGIAEKTPIVLPCIAGVLCILSLFLIGLAAPAFMTMFRDFGLDPLPPHLRVISHIHWAWTLPLGILVAAGLIWSSRHWSRTTTLAVDLLAMALAILVFLAFLFTVFRPIFGPRGIADTTGGSGSSGDPPVHTDAGIGTLENRLHEFMIEFTDASSNRIASGTIQLPSRQQEGTTFAGQCKITVPNPPAKPATQPEHALVSLSRSTGTFSGHLINGHYRIDLDPQADDNMISLEGVLDGNRARGKWYYQSFAGNEEIGMWEAKELP